MQIGKSRRRSPGMSGLRSSASRAAIQFRLPRIVLISPLWAMSRYGWASGQDGNVLVENRECTSAIARVDPLVGQVREEGRPPGRG